MGGFTPFPTNERMNELSAPFALSNNKEEKPGISQQSRRNFLEAHGHAHGVVVALDHEGGGAAVERLVLEASDADGVHAVLGALGDLDVVVAHRVLAADGLLVADGGDEGTAVAGAIRHVQVDVEPVNLGASAVEVVELESASERKE